ncbi:hypothetical protein [Phenylobacterium conjunctum]|uniref:P22 coat-protein 5 family protein n=1 Tax=Phenylobacterium conjunctum TaxID=1298959 RepID=A0ABW3SZE8_9CAUL
MPNVLTAIAPTLFSSARMVANEPFGCVAAIDARFNDKGVAKGDTVTVPVAPIRAASDFTPSNVPLTGGDSSAANVGVTITKSRKVDWHLTGEQMRSIENGAGVEEWAGQLVAQGMRTLRNEAEIDCALAIKVGASRAAGTAGTNPFATALDPLVDARTILQDNGAPLADLQFVGNTSAGNAMRKLGVITNAYQAGSDQERRTGELGRQFGFVPTESAGIATHTKGTGTSYTTNTAGYAIGATQITLITGSGTIVAGDVVTFAGDSNKYVVASGVSAPGVITLAEPGLRQALPASAQAVTVGNNYVANVAFERGAIVGVMRPPLMPANPTITQMPITDQFGMTYLMLDIAQYGQRTWELHLAWGFKTVTPMFSALLLG